MVDDGHRSSGILFRFGHARGADHHIAKLKSGVLQMALRLHLQRHEQRKACQGFDKKWFHIQYNLFNR